MRKDKRDMEDLIEVLRWDASESSADAEKLQELKREVEVMRDDKWDLQEIVERSKVEMETLRIENCDMLENQTALKENIFDLEEDNARLKWEAEESSVEVEILRQMKREFEVIKEEKCDLLVIAENSKLEIAALRNEILKYNLSKSQNVSLCVFNKFRILGEKTKSLTHDLNPPPRQSQVPQIS
jgi:hypothetical protein